MSDENSFVDIVDDSTRGGYYLFVGNTLATLIMFVSSIVVAQLLGPEDYGFFSLVLAVPSLIIGLIEFGMTSTITKFLAEYKSNKNYFLVKHVIKISLLFEVLLGVIGTVVCFVFANQLSTYIINTPEASFYVQLASILILFQSLFNALSSIFLGLDKLGNNAVMMIIRAAAKLMLSAVLVLLGLSISGAIIGHVLCYVLSVGIGFVFVILIIRNKNVKSNPSSDIFYSMMKYGLPIYGAGLLGLFTSQYQTIIVAFFATKIEIGNFQVTTLFQTILTTIIYPFAALFPAFSKLSPESSELNRFFRRAVKYTALLVVPASMAIIVMATNLVFTFYGPEYDLAPIYVVFNTLISLFAGVGSGVFQYLFKGIKRTDITLKSSLINVFVFIPLAPLFTMAYGIVGLISAFLLANVVSLFYMLIIAVRKLNLSIDVNSSVKIYVASGISAFVSWSLLCFLPFSDLINLILSCIVFIFVYLTVLPLIGALNATDIKLFRIQFSKIKSVWPLIKIFLYYETKILNYKLNKKNT